MRKIKVMTVFGTRPEAIKMAPVVKELQSRDEIEEITCVTAQHRQMLDQVLETFKITPDYDLDIMKQGQTLNDVVQRVLGKIGEVLEKERPDIVLVHGDTTTTFAGALAAFHSQIAIGHVEAGLRTWNKYSPYPEEMNRQMVGCLADMHFAPTKVSAQNLLREGKDEKNIYITGNTAIDAMSTTVDSDYKNPIFDWIGEDRMILLTAHRRENLGDPMYHIICAIRRIVDEFDDVKVIYPIHLNPRVREIANDVFEGCDRVRLIEPAPSLGKPVLVLRDTTERPEGIEAGTLKLTGTDEEVIYRETKRLLTDPAEYNSMSHASNPYGDGHASERIVDAIIERFSDLLK